MLPVARKPIVQYVVEELVRNGIEQILFVTGRNKSSIENHSITTRSWFARSPRRTSKICSGN